MKGWNIPSASYMVSSYYQKHLINSSEEVPTSERVYMPMCRGEWVYIRGRERGKNREHVGAQLSQKRLDHYKTFICPQLKILDYSTLQGCWL